MKSFKSGHYINQGSFKSFQPSFINREWQIEDMHLLKLLSKADRYLGRLDMYSEYVNIELYVKMNITKEATQSSKIEGTQTNIEEAFLEKEDVSLEKRDDWEEVQNYINAMNEAVSQLKNLPFSSRLIKETHKILLDGVRGKYKMPGEYRRSQNWIGGASISDAVFIPPIHSSINDLMSDMEKFANDESNPLPDLLKIAIIHYQFETIHPFLDGNGRVGRLLITLYLVVKGILKQPILYLSDFFEKNRLFYYDNLMRARTHNDINQWLKFFLAGVIEISKKTVDTFDKLFQLQKSLEEKLQTFGSRTKEAKKVLEYLYSQPITDAIKIEKITGKSKATNYKLIADFVKIGILKEISGGQRNRLYAFKDFINLYKDE
jgi:Fic family protein